MKIIIAAILSIICIFCAAQTESDTLLSPMILVSQEDSIITKAAVIPQYQLINIPDSVYIQRLTALPFNFKMSYNPIVRSYIELYTVRIKDKMQVIMGLSDFYFPIIDTVFNAYNIPNELKYVSIIESALNPIAVSPARATGLWQFMKGTGKENGLVINNYVDQRRGVLESSQAAAKYLRSLYNMYNDWQLVIAAYNCGQGRVNRAIRRAKGKTDYWEIYRYLPKETRGYVPAFIGAAYAFNYYKEHNICPASTILPLQTDTVTVNKQLHFGQVADVLGVSIDLLRQINPQYIKDVVPANDKSQYSLRVPLSHKAKFTELKDSIFAWRTDFYEKEINKKLKYIQPQSITMVGGRKRITHSVESGESLWLIAGQYNVSINNIREWNKISGNKLKLGQRLVVYVQ